MLRIRCLIPRFIPICELLIFRRFSILFAALPRKETTRKKGKYPYYVDNNRKTSVKVRHNRKYDLLQVKLAHVRQIYRLKFISARKLQLNVRRREVSSKTVGMLRELQDLKSLTISISLPSVEPTPNPSQHRGITKAL